MGKLVFLYFNIIVALILFPMSSTCRAEDQNIESNLKDKPSDEIGLKTLLTDIAKDIVKNAKANRIDLTKFAVTDEYWNTLKALANLLAQDDPKAPLKGRNLLKPLIIFQYSQLTE